MNSNSPGDPVADAPGSVSPARRGSRALSRRTLVGGVAASGALLSVGGWAPVVASRHERTPHGPGSVAGAPHLPDGFEDVFFGAEFAAAAGANKLPEDVVRYYVRMLRSDGAALQGSFGFYRAWWTTAAQNMTRFGNKLTVPVLAIGGEQSSNALVGAVMKAVASDVQTVVIPGSGHWVAEEAPDQIVAALTAFLG